MKWCECCLVLCNMKNWGRHGMTLKFNRRGNLKIRFLILWCATSLPIKSFSGSIIHTSATPKNHFPLPILSDEKFQRKWCKYSSLILENRSTVIHRQAFFITFPFETLSISIHTLGIEEGYNFYWNTSQFQNLISRIWEFNTKS